MADRWRHWQRVLAHSDGLVLTRLRRRDATAVAEAVDDDTCQRFGWTEGDALREVDRVRRGRFNLYRGVPADLAIRARDDHRYLGSVRAGWDGLDETTTELTVRWFLHPSARDAVRKAEAVELVVRYFAGRTPVTELRMAEGNGGGVVRIER